MNVVWDAERGPPWRSTDALTPDSLWDFIQRYERVTGHRPKLEACVEEFDGKKLGVTICLWELERRGLIGRDR